MHSSVKPLFMNANLNVLFYLAYNNIRIDLYLMLSILFLHYNETYFVLLPLSALLQFCALTQKL